MTNPGFRQVDTVHQEFPQKLSLFQTTSPNELSYFRGIVYLYLVEDILVNYGR